MVYLGVANGERPRDRKMVIETITAMMVGLMGISDLVPGAQARTVEELKRRHRLANEESLHLPGQQEGHHGQQGADEDTSNRVADGVAGGDGESHGPKAKTYPTTAAVSSNSTTGTSGFFDSRT